MATYAFNEDKLLIEVYSKAETDALLADKVNESTFTQQMANKVSTTTFNQAMANKADRNHTHAIADLSGNLPFSRVTGLTFSLSGTTLRITKS